ncbi:hypothetical protein HY212_00735 [Candidatus Pacearchaeota archaeon]|nr:hypothetical protein [Candidatus Pacearchaeota archaeon]
MDNIITAITYKSASDYIGYVEMLVIDLPLRERLRLYEAYDYKPNRKTERVLFNHLPEEELSKIRDYFKKRINETRELIL